MPSGTGSPALSRSTPRMRTERGSESSTSRFVIGPPKRPILRYGPTVWDGLSPSSVIVRLLERRRLAAPEHDVEAKAERPVRLGELELELRDQALPGAPVADGAEDRVEREERIAGEVHL